MSRGFYFPGFFLFKKRKSLEQILKMKIFRIDFTLNGLILILKYISIPIWNSMRRTFTSCFYAVRKFCFRAFCVMRIWKPLELLLSLYSKSDSNKVQIYKKTIQITKPNLYKLNKAIYLFIVLIFTSNKHKNLSDYN